ncbi:MAG TPA: AEC family transporter [Propionicimonas sp.]|nr:AEC family transporter [Propionicimonas sp.]HQA76870.1 AEC family transporter [Propionicimonas sp.]HQD97306.1 AEC family transporter [Propionicimonas sp.]
MQAALSGYLTIWSVIGVGWVVAHFRVLTEDHRRMLSRLAFTVASPALLFSLVSRADLSHLFSRTLLVSALAIALAAGAYLIAARVWFGGGDLPGRVVGTLCAAYTNAGNLGLPIAAYVLGDMTWMAPIILIQVGVLQPTALALLDLGAARKDGVRLTWWRYASLPVRNPITLGTLAGLAVNLLGIEVPTLLWEPIEMIGQVAVPAMLLAFGISLRLDPLPGRGRHARELALAAPIKVLLHPAIAFALGAWVFGLSTADLLAVTVIAALPTAQNIYLIAGRYHVRTLLARDAIFISTIASIPVIVAASTWLR